MSPLAPVPDPAARLAFLADADHAAVLAEAVAVRARGGVPVVGDERWPADLRAAQREHAVVQLRRLAARDPDLAARVGWAAFTSGSTSRPRVVLRTDDSWRAGHPHVAAWLGLAPGEAMLTAVHPVSSMALHAAAWCAATGHRLAVSPHARLTAADLTGPAALTATPSQLTDALDLLDDGAPSTLRVALVGGDRLPAGARERAAAHGLRTVHYYGAAEASFVAVDLDGSGLRPLPGVELEVAEPDVLADADGPRTGVLRVASPQLAVPDDSRLASGAPRWDAEGRLTTGDRVTWDPAAGILTVHGRADEVVLTAGATVSAADVEAELAAVAGPDGRPVAAGVLVLGVPDPRLGQRVAAAVEPAPGVAPEDALAALQGVARARLSPAARPRRWVAVGRLERTGSGKIRRVTPPELRP
ncbi:acyl--CoA ligase [Micrococcus porci]|uniref:AMP-binding protein n=1 Tax=Micrococcus porci TaxID=2856555 RepID=UPI001CC8F395|nr:class I adenylate-forming enzyme family protein [Micrococcus porci]UBH25293.1 acyl--CoA ligase [Micrococcus porci]